MLIFDVFPNIHETVIFDVIFHILEVSSGRWVSVLVTG